MWKGESGKWKVEWDMGKVESGRVKEDREIVYIGFDFFY